MNITFDKSELRSDYVVLDLSKNLKKEEIKPDVIKTNDFADFETFEEFAVSLIQNFEYCLSDPDDGTTKRLVIGDFFSWFDFRCADDISRIYQLVKAIKRLTRVSNTIVVMVMSTKACEALENIDFSLKTFESFFDFVLNIMPFHNNKLFSDFHANLVWQKMSLISKFREFPLKHYSFGIKNYKSTLDIELLYENSISHTDDTNEDNRLVCKPGPSGQDNLDFQLTEHESS